LKKAIVTLEFLAKFEPVIVTSWLIIPVVGSIVICAVGLAVVKFTVAAMQIKRTVTVRSVSVVLEATFIHFVTYCDIINDLKAKFPNSIYVRTVNYRRNLYDTYNAMHEW